MTGDRLIGGKPVALMQVPNRALFTPGLAARYLGISYTTLIKITDLGHIEARNFYGRRAYLLDDLNRLIENLPAWNDAAGENPRRSLEEVTK